MQRASTQAVGLRGTYPLQDVTGKKLNISEYLDFGSCDHVSYKDNSVLGMTGIGGGLEYPTGLAKSCHILYLPRREL